MKSRAVRISAAALVLIVLAGASAHAMDGMKTVEAYYRNISITVNGKTTAPDTEPFIVDGRTYVPLRAVAQALGASVRWDGDQNQVVITTPDQRVYVKDVMGQAAPDPYLNTWSIRYVGVTVNATDDRVHSISLSCKATDATGAIVDITAQTLSPSNGDLQGHSSLAFDWVGHSHSGRMPDKVSVTCSVTT